MRKIKFRGQRQSDNMWLYGDLLQPTECCNIYEISDCESFDGSRYDVIEDTIGQFTGLHDKNGKEIYEGDIVKVKNVDYHIGQIIYDEEYAEYEIEIGKDSAFPISVLYTLSYNLDIEVIGNMYESLELLKGDDNIE